ncbi:MAG TPA: KOW motif-containing protein [Spirochaetia bacterium]|nr:KOW motif-containing protein [Spirochaetia bacterium]
MNYFVIQVLTRSEEKFIRLATNLLSHQERDFETVGSIDSRVNEPRVRTGNLLPGRARPSDIPQEAPPGFANLPRGFSPDALPGRFVWPRRKLSIRRKGKTQSSLAPIFPGYVFYEAEEVHPRLYWAIRQLTGFVRILRNDGSLEALGGEDRELLTHFLSYGEVVDKSLVYFDDNRRIRVKSGPMKGLEGRIIKVDKRKKRAKISLSIYSDRFLVDFGFELLESAEGNERKAN